MKGSKFFRATRQSQLKKLPAVCSRCKKSVKPTVHNAVWVMNAHTGYLCDDPKCLDGVAKLE